MSLFIGEELILRPYQSEALDALDAHLASRDDNPCVVLPTGAGKTPFMVGLVQRYIRDTPDLRVVILAHIRELLDQTYREFKKYMPDVTCGIYCAGLGHREHRASVTVASIQSIVRLERPRFDLAIVDEAHRIPVAGDGQYRTFLQACQEMNPSIRCVGLTATPYRLEGGAVCGKNSILNHICYTANVKVLIAQGYLCPVTAKAGSEVIDRSKLTVRKGEFASADIEGHAMATAENTVKDILKKIDAARRNSVLIFCSSIRHCEIIAAAFKSNGLVVPTLSNETAPMTREMLVKKFKDGHERILLNINILSEGFNARNVDCIVMLRPTKSAGLYYQQVGRGLRTHPGKDFCLVLDYAGNICSHGPIDELEESHGSQKKKAAVEKAKGRTCPNCGSIIKLSVPICPDCGHLFVRIERPAVKHHDKPVSGDVISNSELRVMRVDRVEILPSPPWERFPHLACHYFCGPYQFTEAIDPFGKSERAQRSLVWLQERFLECAHVHEYVGTIDKLIECLKEYYGDIGERVKNYSPAIRVKITNGVSTKIVGYLRPKNQVPF